VALRTLKNRAEFQRVRDGSKWAAKAFVLQGLARAEGSEHGARFGFAVGSKALTAEPKIKGQPPKRPGAVMRNRARRRLKEAVRLIAPHCANADFDYVVIGRREALHQSFPDLLEDMQIAFDKVHRPPHGKGRSAKPRALTPRAAGAD
jgi:ribonuclease P protein component